MTVKALVALCNLSRRYGMIFYEPTERWQKFLVENKLVRVNKSNFLDLTKKGRLYVKAARSIFPGSL